MRSKEEINEIVQEGLNKEKIKFDENRNSSFSNHMYYFYQRTIKQEKLNIKLEESILSQVNDDTWKQSQIIIENFCNKLKELQNSKIPDEEIFLIATYLLV